MDVTALEEISSFVTSGIAPDVTILLDISPEEGLCRRKKNPDTWNRLDAYSIDFHERVRKGFLRLAKNSPNRWEVIDASQSEEAIFAAASGVLLKALDKRGV